MRWLPLLCIVAWCASCSGPPAPAPKPRSRFLDDLQRASERSEAEARVREDLPGCLRWADREYYCTVPNKTRTLAVRVALDPAYTTKWPGWQERLRLTFSCVNRLFASTGVQWDVQTIKPWSPGAQRLDLVVLLDRLEQELPADDKSVVAGIAVWDERQIYSAAIEMLGVMRGATCIVPSWPRVENDCATMAHELGHVVGARHVDDEQSIMSRRGMTFHFSAGDPIARLVALYRFDPRNLAVSSLYRRAEFTDGRLVLSENCQRHAEALDICYGLDQASDS